MLQVIAERKKTMEGKREEVIKELRKRELSKSERIADFVKKREAELAERKLMADYELARTSRSTPPRSLVGVSGSSIV